MQKRRILTSDLTATVDIDPELARQQQIVGYMRQRLKAITDRLRRAREDRDRAAGDLERNVAEQMLSDAEQEHEVASSVLRDAVSCMREYRAIEDSERPSVTIRYMPPAKVTEIKVRAQVARKMTDEVERGIASAEIDRDLVRWGVCGWRMDDPDLKWETESVKHRGREMQIGAWEMIDMLEATGWIAPIALEVLEYNDLDAATLGKSLRPAGTRRGHSSAASAKSDPA
jgi:hypothetical protein